MRAYSDKSDHIPFLEEYCTIVSRDINTATAGISFVDKVVVEDWVIHILKKKIPSFLKSIFNLIRKF